MGNDPQMDNEPPVNGPDNDMENGIDDNPADDSTMDIINQLSDTDREAVRAYAESMLARDETEDESGMDGDSMSNQPEPDNNQMFETFKFSKKQLEEMAKRRKK